jgi:hypothetical protein
MEEIGIFLYPCIKIGAIMLAPGLPWFKKTRDLQNF